MKRGLWILAAYLLVLPFAIEQQKESPPPTIKVRAELVLIPVVVSKDGVPVKGLTAKDFVLLHKGQPEQVTEFEEVEAVPARVEPVNLPPRTVQNFAAADTHQDVVILLLDYLNAEHSTDKRIRRHLVNMVGEFAATRTPVTFLILSYKGLVRVHSFASDAENLIKAAEQWSTTERGRGQKISSLVPGWASPIGQTDAAQTLVALQQFAILPEKAPKDADYVRAGDLNKRAMTQRAVEQIAEAFGGIPGRKKLIWVSTDFPSYGSRVADQKSEISLRGSSLRRWKSLSDANISIYPVITNGVKQVFVRPEQYGFLAEFNGFCGQPNLISISTARYGQNDNICDEEPTKCLQRPLADTHYYVLGFYLHGVNKPGWHSVQVKVGQPKVTVSFRQGFVVGDSSAPPNMAEIEENALAKASPNDDAVRVALSSPLDYTSVPLRLHWNSVVGQGNKPQVELVVSSPPGGIVANTEDMSLSVDFLAFFKPAGTSQGRAFPTSLSTVLSPEQQKTFATAGFRFRNEVNIAPGRYEVRVLVRDNVARKMGTVSTIIDLSSPPAPASSTIRP